MTVTAPVPPLGVTDVAETKVVPLKLLCRVVELLWLSPDRCMVVIDCNHKLPLTEWCHCELGPRLSWVEGVGAVVVVQVQERSVATDLTRPSG